MIWLKYTGMCCILLAGTGMGFSGCIRVKERENALKTIIRILSALREEIRFGNIPLREAFYRVSRKVQGEFHLCLGQIAEEMEHSENASFSDIFRKYAEHALKVTPLSKEEKRSFLELGNDLGHLDIQVQLQELEKLQTVFIGYQESLQEEMKGKMKLYKNVGFFGALMLVVLIW